MQRGPASSLERQAQAKCPSRTGSGWSGRVWMANGENVGTRLAQGDPRYGVSMLEREVTLLRSKKTGNAPRFLSRSTWESQWERSTAI